MFDAAVLRGLDARARREIEDAGRLVSVNEGGVVYRAGDEGASFFVVAEGRVSLRAVRRGDGGETELRAAGPGESFGEESTVGLARRAAAVALEPGAVAEIPVHVFRRAVARSGKAEVAARLERSLTRTATADLLRTSPSPATSRRATSTCSSTPSSTAASSAPSTSTGRAIPPPSSSSSPTAWCRCRSRRATAST